MYICTQKSSKLGNQLNFKARKDMNGHVDDTRVLVAGGAGFIGSHLCDRLINEGHRVLCIDLVCALCVAIQYILRKSKISYVDCKVITIVAQSCQRKFSLICPFYLEHFQNVFSVYMTDKKHYLQ